MTKDTQYKSATLLKLNKGGTACNQKGSQL